MPTHYYNGQSVEGQTWQRASKIVFDNSLSGNLSVLFNEERVVKVGDKVATSFVGNLVGNFAPTGTVPLRNPETNELTGQTVSHADIYILLYSLYMQHAEQRDIDEAQRISDSIAALFSANTPP